MTFPINYVESAALGENDNKRRLSCRAFNKNIPGSTIEDHWDVLVMCECIMLVVTIILQRTSFQTNRDFDLPSAGL